MKLLEALTLLNERKVATAEPFETFLASGFTPLHLGTFLAAHLATALPGRHVDIRSGTYGNLQGSLERLAMLTPRPPAAVVIEWSDLDPRLGIRRLGGWGGSQLLDVVQCVEASCDRIVRVLDRLPAGPPAVIATPTLPLPPIFHTGGWQAEGLETALVEAVARFTKHAAHDERFRVVSRERLDRISPVGRRFDARSELRYGFPYTLPHADALGDVLATLIASPQPKKGIITDLDDTLWRGLVGEDGVDAVSWDGPAGTMHGLYQQLLCALSERGVLVATASRNDPAVVDEAFKRSDLLLPRDRVYPIRATWGAKSESVREILNAWNVGADTVIFVDDSPLELAEVKTAYPDIGCLLFQKDDPQAIWRLLEELRDFFGKSVVLEEDRLRLASLRTRAEMLDSVPAGGAEDLLKGIGALVNVDYRKRASDRRPLELLNKTNQFNLNCRRYTDHEWHAQLARSDSFLMRVSYKDKFGPLGEIAVLTGTAGRAGVSIDAWVLSCRAFGRRIEHQCLRALFARFGVSSLAIDYQPTPRNHPFREFLNNIALPGVAPDSRIAREQFDAACPPLYHEVHEVPDVEPA
jgi:FkbH-like protein